MTLGCVIRSEATKLATMPSTWILFAVTILGTWPMAWSNAAAYRLPPDDPRLFGELGPVASHGFEMAGFGCTLVVALGALWAASEYGSAKQIQATLTATPRRGRVMGVKLALLALATAALALVTMVPAIAITHAAADDGIDPVRLTPQIWLLLAGLVADWVTTALLAFALGMLARSAILPLLALLPLVVGLGTFLASIWSVASYFPITAGAALHSAPGTDAMASAGLGGAAQVAWAGTACTAAWIAFVRRDA